MTPPPLPILGYAGAAPFCYPRAAREVENVTPVPLQREAQRSSENREKERLREAQRRERKREAQRSSEKREKERGSEKLREERERERQREAQRSAEKREKERGSAPTHSLFVALPTGIYEIFGGSTPSHISHR